MPVSLGYRHPHPGWGMGKMKKFCTQNMPKFITFWSSKWVKKCTFPLIKIWGYSCFVLTSKLKSKWWKIFEKQSKELIVVFFLLERMRMRRPHHGGSVIHKPNWSPPGRGGGTRCRALGEMALAAGGLYYAL